MNAIQIGGLIEVDEKKKKVKIKGARILDHGADEVEEIKKREKDRKVKLPEEKKGK